MKLAWLVVALCLASAAATVVRKLADANFLKRQWLVLDMFVGLGHDEHLHNDYVNFDVANGEHYTHPTVGKLFMDSYKDILPKHAIYTPGCLIVRFQTKWLSDVFYFAKDFDVLIKVARWAKRHVNPIMFAIAFSEAVKHREDCRGFKLPPVYEVFPSYFVPQDTMHFVYDSVTAGVKEGRFAYNNTGYEYNHHDEMFGGPLSHDSFHFHNEYKVSYFREDVGLNHMFSVTPRFPGFVDWKKHNQESYKEGEKFYNFHQQLLARYNFERLSNGLPYAEAFDFDTPIRVGYNPRVSHFNGESFIARPDNQLINNEYNRYYVEKALREESRLVDAIDYSGYWNVTTDTLVNMINDKGTDMLGNMMMGAWFGKNDPNANYFGAYFYSLLESVAYNSRTKNTVNLNGGATATKFTAVRDPAFYNILVRMMSIFQKLKTRLAPYNNKELMFNGVTVDKFEVDKLMTYFEMFDFEVTNGVAVKNVEDYKDMKFQASQYRLNHKPFTYKITVNSETAQDGFVRVFIGPKFDSEGHKLSLNQMRMTMFEIDHFPIKMNAGVNTFERNSRESHCSTPDLDGFRALYERLDHATKDNEPYYYTEKAHFGYPHRLMLPRGWKQGYPINVVVVVTPNAHECETSGHKDCRAYGYPFDRVIRDQEFHVPNIFFKDEFIFHKNEFEVSRTKN